MTSKITDLFNKFAGQEVNAIETNTGIFWDPKTVALASPNPVIDELEKTAKEAGLTLRVVFSGTREEMSFRNDRLSAYVDKGADGKYRIARFDVC